jgi:hypothetical protein
LVDDPSPEALVLHLAESRGFAGVFSSEGGTFVGGTAFNDETKIRTGALLNKLWDAGEIRRLRVGTGKTFLRGRRCSMHIMLQPVVAEQLFGDDQLAGLGTLARVLTVAPESAIGSRRWREQPADVTAILNVYNTKLLNLLTRQPRSLPDDPQALDPIELTLHPNARVMWIGFHDHVEAEVRTGGALAPIQGFAAKLPEHAGRLAAVLAAYGGPDCVEVSPEAMANGIELAQHYAGEMLRLHGAAAVASDLKLAQRLLIWLQARGAPLFHLAEVYQRGLNTLGDAATARRIVSVLEDHRWLKRLEPGTEVDGKPRREAWKLIP